MSMSDVPVVELVNVYKVHQMPAGDVRALNGVKFSVMRGEFVAIMGPSGSGKSTLMNMIGCLDVPTTGEMYIDGRSVKEMTDDELTEHCRDRIGFIIQKFNLIGLLTAYENLEYPMILKFGMRDTTGRPKELLARRWALTPSRRCCTHHLSSPAVSSSGWQLPGHWPNDPALLLCG